LLSEGFKFVQHGVALLNIGESTENDGHKNDGPSKCKGKGSHAPAGA